MSELNNQKKNYEYDVKGKEKDYTIDAIEAIRECVNEFLEIDDLKANKEQNEKLYNNRKLTIVSCYNYLKKKKSDTKEFEEAKKLILSISNKHQKLASWCEYVINIPLTKSPILISDAELNIDKTNELIIDDGPIIIVDTEKAKKLIDLKIVLGSHDYNNLKFEYKVIANGKEYNWLYHVVNYMPKCDCSESCPYRVSLIGWEKNKDNERILKFNIFEIDQNINNLIGGKYGTKRRK